MYLNLLYTCFISQFFIHDFFQIEIQEGTSLKIALKYTKKG